MADVIAFEAGVKALQDRAKRRCEALAASAGGKPDPAAALVQSGAKRLARGDFRCPCGAQRFFVRREGLRCSGCGSDTPWDAVFVIVPEAGGAR